MSRKPPSNDDSAFEFIDHYGYPPRTERPESERVPWPESKPPAGGATILVMDGLATRSRRFLGRSPLIDVYRSAVEKRRRSAHLTGYSYYEPGFHYEAFDTLLPVAALVEQTMQWYMPTSNLQIAYTAFSIAAPVAALALGEWSRARRIGSARPVVFLQPAFAVSRDVLKRWYASGSRVPPAVDELARAPGPHQERLFRAVEQMRDSAAVGPMHLLYWPDDKFIEYPNWLTRRLENLDVAVTPIPNLTFPRGVRKGFGEHCYVARHPDMVARVLDIVLPSS